MTFGEVAMPAAGREEAVESISGIIVETKDYILAKDKLANAIIFYWAKYQIRLKAQMMNDMLQDDKPGDRHVYVRIPGSDRVREIIFYDGEDELLEHEVGPEERKKVKNFSIVNCMVQPTWIRSKIKFLMDTGCGHDLFSQRKVGKHGLETLVSEEAISFQTANGVTNTDLISNFQTETFTEPINVYVLDDTPSVLSVGKRCMKQGYGFEWPPAENPFMINPEGKRKEENPVDATPGEEEVKKYQQKKQEDLLILQRTLRGAFKRELKAWGDLITFDFLDMRRAADMGIGNDDEMREVLVVRDVATNVIAAIPTMSRYTDDVVEALKRLIGRRKVKLAYSDVAPEFDAAMAQLKIPIDHSLPGLPKNTSLAERTNQEVINTVATSLLHAGLPAQYWHFALNCVTHDLNIEDVEGDGDSAWKRMTGEDFKGKAVPFGAKVFFKTTDTRDKTYAGKFDPKGITGVFAGYAITTGQQWSRKYKVWDMAEFTGVNLSMDAAVPRKLAQPYLTEVVVLPEDLVFPLKNEYERMNSTLEGLNDNRRLQGKEIKDADDVDRPPSGGDGDDYDDDDDSKKKPPPDPDEIDDGGGAGGIALDDYYTAVDAIGEKILERDEIDAGAHRAPPPSSILGRTGGPIEHDDVGPSGRLIPKGGEEDPGEILRCLKDAKLASDDVEHWSVGTKGDGIIYLSDDGEACKIDKRGVPYKIGSDGKRILPSRRPKHLYSPEEWDKVDAKTKKKAYKKAKRENAKDAKVSRRKEMLDNPKAMEAFMKEWKGLWEQEVFDFSQTREYDDVVNEAKRKGQKVHMARVHGLIYEKNYQLKEDDPARKFKGRGVLLGDQVKDQNMEAALFQDLGNSPATFDASRWADYYGCLPGNDVQMADAIQAYIQALYGHPDAGTMWEQHCHTAVQKVGFKPLGDEWPSLYFHPEMKLLLVIYVDDLKMAGPQAQLPKGWSMLRKELRLEEEAPLGLYLGCCISKGEAVLHDKTPVRTVTYDMETYLDMTVKKYCDVTRFDPSKFKTVPSPSPAEESKNHPARAPMCNGKSYRCTWCGNTMPVDADGRLIPPPPIPKGPTEEEVTDAKRGALAPHSASILMKLLYAARICRFDLLRSINNLARKTTKWTKKEDALLHHLMAYVQQSKHHLMIGRVGDSLGDSSIGLFADADYAGCGESLKSTSGAHLHIQGGKDPNFVFYDDNQTMIGVVRTGKNPTMRHLERTHGISVGRMRSIFQEGYVSLAYEVTAKMAADIHTKSFKDSVSWTHACQLINIFPPEQIGSQDIMDLMRPTHSQSTDEKGQQLYTFKSEVPCFPYTKTPILPQVLYRAGLSSKEGLQEHDSVDPILVVKFPRMLRDPPSALPPGRYLRFTWILREGLVIEFYDNTKELVHTYKDEGNKLGVKIKIFDTPRELAIWTLIGVDEDSWWQQYAPGLGDATEFAPEQHYVPQTRMNILCTGRQVDDAMCDYLADVFRNKQKVIIEVPPEAQVAGTKQYRLLSNKELWRHNVIDGCSHGQRLLVRDPENQPCVKYCNKKWEFFSADTAMEHKLSDACKAKHNHACEQDYSDLSGKEVRTSQISRRLLRALSFKEGDGRLISMPAKKPKSGCDGVVVYFGHDRTDDRKGLSRQVDVLHVEPPKTVAQQTEVVAKIKKL
ncbi:unnamed protein product [Symbiodinium sp. KB8]|nr:unnamed protein product [Symbiodinium sp. KB8]